MELKLEIRLAMQVAIEEGEPRVIDMQVVAVEVASEPEKDAASP